ncbi:MAG: MoaD/ThiS family protein [bacterium]|nr:MoaD/ThiS family protein [bacterium]
MQSENNTNVYIDLYGMLKGSSGKKRHVLAVSSVLKDAVKDVREYLGSLNIPSSYILYVNDTFVKSALERHSDYLMSEGDVFKVIPIVSGG